MSKYYIDVKKNSDVQLKKKIINKTLICIEEFAMFRVGDTFYCYAIDDSGKIVGYCRRLDFEFRLGPGLLEHFKIEV